MLRLTALAYDGTHRVGLGNPWQQFRDWAVPKAVESTLGRALGGLLAFNPVGRKSIVLYGEYAPAGKRTHSSELKIAFADAHGFESGTNWWGVDQNGKGNQSMSYTVNLPGRPDVPSIFWELHQFPRRGSTIRTCFYEETAKDQWTSIAEFTLPNPGLAC